MIRKTMLMLIAMGCALAGLAGAAESPKTLDLGAAAPNFALPGVDGKTHTLKDFAAAKVLVVIFTCNHCPTAQAYEQRIIKLHADYQDKGVALVAISPNDPRAVRLSELGYTDLTDSLEDMKIRARERGFKFPYLYDGETQAVSRVYGPAATPHVFIFDSERKLRYTGRIDDAEVKEIHSHDTRNAIEDLLAGRPVAVPKTRVFGCSTKWAVKAADAAKSLEKWNAEPVTLNPIDVSGASLTARGDAAKLRLVNLWATWCGPCLSELPELVTINRMYRGRPFELITITIDDAAKRERALELLKERHVAARNFIYTGESRDKLADALDKEWQGPLPHTLLIAPGGKVIYRKSGEIDPLELKKAIVDYLGRTY